MSESNTQKTLTSITILFTIALPHLYIFEFAYQVGYLGRYGISNELFPRSVPEYLTSSLLFFMTTFTFSAKYIISGLALIITGFVIYAVLMLLADYKSEALLKKPIQWYTKFQPYILCIKTKLLKINYKILAQPAKVAFGLFITFYGLLGLMLYASLVTLIPLYVGQKVASDEIKEAPLCKLERTFKDCVQLMEYDDVIASGKIIANSDKYLALYNDGKATIYSKNDYTLITKIRYQLSQE